MSGKELCRNTSQFLWYLQQYMWPSLCTYENKSSGELVWWFTLICIFTSVHPMEKYTPNRKKFARQNMDNNQQKVRAILPWGNISTHYASSNLKIKFVTLLRGTIMKRAQTFGLIWFPNENRIHVYLNIPIYLNSRHPHINFYWYAVRYIHEHLHSIKYNPAASTVFSFRLAMDFSSTAFCGWNNVKTNAENSIPEEYCSY